MFNFLKLFNFLKSTILIKIVMALTGLAVVGFLFGHAIGNLQFWLGPDAYNSYAAFLQGLGEILWLIRIGLIGCLILHIICAVYLRLKNNAAKPIGYKIKTYVKAKLTSRTMLWTGLLVLLGLLFHLLHFTTDTINFNNGHNQYEVYPTGEYVIGLGGCSDDNACYKAKDDCCGDCNETDASCSDKPCCQVDKDCSSKCDNADASCSDKPCKTAEKSCSGSCPPGDKMCASCEANPEQCSKYTCVDTSVLFCHTDCKTECADKKKDCATKCCDADGKCKTDKNCICLKNIFLNNIVLVGEYLSHLGNINDPDGIMTIKDGTGSLVATLKECDKGSCAFIEDGYTGKVCCWNGNLYVKRNTDNVEVLVVKAGKKFNHYPTYSTPDSAPFASQVVKERPDVYGMVKTEFSCPWVALAYIIFVCLVGFHLNHAIQSSVHTLGIEGPKFTPVMRILSTLLSIGLVLMFIILPLGVVLNNLLGCNCILGGF